MKIESENDVKKKVVLPWFKIRNAWSFAPVQTGLGTAGIPDRVGCVPVRITQDMVGQTFGLFVAVECKRPGRRGEKDRGLTKNQVNILNEINAAEGVSFVCDGEEDLRNAGERWPWLI